MFFSLFFCLHFFVFFVDFLSLPLAVVTRLGLVFFSDSKALGRGSIQGTSEMAVTVSSLFGMSFFGRDRIHSPGILA